VSRTIANVLLSLGNLTPEELAVQNQMGSALASHRLASRRPGAGRRDATGSGLGSKTLRFVGHPPEHVKGGRKSLKLGNEPMSVDTHEWDTKGVRPSAPALTNRMIEYDTRLLPSDAARAEVS